jgi:hypothetical protein
MRHILLDDDGLLWIVGWNWSGFYPTWFEYLGMRLAARENLEPSSWKTAINFVAEPSLGMERWMERITRVVSEVHDVPLCLIFPLAKIAFTSQSFFLA